VRWRARERRETLQSHTHFVAFSQQAFKGFNLVLAGQEDQNIALPVPSAKSLPRRLERAGQGQREGLWKGQIQEDTGSG
jgi:hypothetical protein